MGIDKTNSRRLIDRVRSAVRNMQDQHAVRAGAVGRAVAPIEFEELLGDRTQREFELAAVIGAQEPV